ncbi:MAG: hypothetical protein ACYC91_04140 [Solirubrobacteraceae bacterium]
MLLWWLGNLVLLVVVVPVVVLLLHNVVAAAVQSRRIADALAAAGPVLVGDLDAVGQLVETQELVHETMAGLARYGAALDRIL